MEWNETEQNKMELNGIDIEQNGMERNRIKRKGTEYDRREWNIIKKRTGTEQAKLE